MFRGAAGVTVNSALELVIALTLNEAFPVFETVSVSVAELPVVTEPKLSDVGETPIVGAAATVPVPDNATCADGCDTSLLAIVSVPDCDPALVGLNRTVTCVDDPAATFRGAGGVTVNTPLEL